YVVPMSPRFAVAELRGELAAKLPEHMIPSVWMVVQELPLTPNGKLHRLALPRPDGESISRTSEWVPARNPIEQKLVAIWSSILRVRKVGIFDSFFELGGHSLLA